MTGMRRCLLIASVLLLGAPAAADAHSIVRVSSGVVSYISSDAISLNTLELTTSGTDIRMSDPTVEGGIDPGTSCRPGDTNQKGEVTEVFCGRTGTNQVRVELGEREDTMRSSLGVPILALGGGGADTLASGALADILVGNEGNDTLDGGAGNDQVNGSAGDDTVRGGPGNDVVQAGPGVDEVDAGPGDDDVRVRDGSPDRIGCGDGSDKVDADPNDEVAADCEAVTRSSAPAPPEEEPAGTAPSASGGESGSGGSSGGGDTGGGGGSDGGGGSLRDDKVAPRLEVGGSTSQKLRSSGVVRLLATSSERGTMAASGFVEIAGLALPLVSKVERVPSAGGGVTIAVKLSRSQMRRARRALRKRRRVRVRLDVVATDLAGNSTARRGPAIRLRR